MRTLHDTKRYGFYNFDFLSLESRAGSRRRSIFPLPDFGISSSITTPPRSFLYGATFDVLLIKRASSGLWVKRAQRAQRLNGSKFFRNLTTIRYCKGQYNVVADALSWMPEVKSLYFTKIKSYLFDNLCNQYEHVPCYKDVWKSVISRDRSPQDSAQ